MALVAYAAKDSAGQRLIDQPILNATVLLVIDSITSIASKSSRGAFNKDRFRHRELLRLQNWSSCGCPHRSSRRAIVTILLVREFRCLEK